MPKKSHNYTVMIVPDREGRSRRFTVTRTLLRMAAALSILLFATVTTMAVHYFGVVEEAMQVRSLKDDNLRLRSELRLVEEKIAHVGSALERVERLDAKLRMITKLSDPDRNLAMGPLAEGTSPDPVLPEIGALRETPRAGDIDRLATDQDIELLHAKLDNLTAEARHEEDSLRELQEYFQDQKTLLGAMPSIWPARGWVTSTFGGRIDPFTGERMMHTGLDIAAEIGTRVRGTADGTVIFAGPHGAYGQVIVIDHGYGVHTRFGHLSKLFVGLGHKVRRGDVIGAIGNTGRSTGPHLHYEIRVNGIPEDPRKFILD